MSVRPVHISVSYFCEGTIKSEISERKSVHLSCSNRGDSFRKYEITTTEKMSVCLRTDDTKKIMDAWIDIYFLTYFHCKLYK
jgi:hypothetical protein